MGSRSLCPGATKRLQNLKDSSQKLKVSTMFSIGRRKTNAVRDNNSWLIGDPMSAQLSSHDEIPRSGSPRPNAAHRLSFPSMRSLVNRSVNRSTVASAPRFNDGNSEDERGLNMQRRPTVPADIQFST